MLNDKVRAELDQSQEFIVETIPHLLHRFYSSLVEEGFTQYEALSLTKEYLFTTFSPRE